MKDKIIEIYNSNITLLDTMLNDISNVTLDDIHNWLDKLYEELEKVPNLTRTCNCWYCGHDIIWGCDYDYSDIYGEGEGIVSHLHCPHCGASIEYTLRTDEEEISMEDFEDKHED